MFSKGNALRFLGILLISAVLLSACGAATNFLYGPNLTPDQTRAMVAEDADFLGRYRITAAPTEYAAILARIQEVRGVADPLGWLAEKFYDYLRLNENDNELVGYAVRRLLVRFGIRITDIGYDRIPGIDFDKDLFLYALDAYEAGVKKKAKILGIIE